MTQPWAQLKARRRQRARESGLCITCCKIAPEEGRSVCKICSSHATLRKAQYRHKQREVAHLQKVIAAHERAGDQAYEHHLYQDAAYWYEHAVNLREALLEDRLRITEKLIRAYFLGNNPGKAVPLTEWLTENYSSLPGGDIKAVEALNVLFQQLTVVSFDADTLLPIVVRAMEMAKVTGVSQLIAVASLNYLIYLTAAQHYDMAARFLEEAPPIDSYEDVTIRARYYAQKGGAAAKLGEMEACYENFEHALTLVKESSDILGITNVWLVYAMSAVCLGDIGRAKSVVESAMFVTREHQVTWRLSHLCSIYAEILAIIGQDAVAKEFISQAFAYEASGKMVNSQLIEVSIPLALRTSDAALLARCEKLIPEEKHFLEPNTAGAIALLHASRGEYLQAQELLHDVVLLRSRHPDLNWEALLIIARYGKNADISVARAIFEQRLRFPKATLTQAFLHLFDAFIAERRKKKKATINYATAAAQLFEELGWYGYARQAHMLRGVALPSTVEWTSLPANYGAGLHVGLTSREQQIAELVLRGFTNRMIAIALDITENTVETHMKSIMNRLGIRSRHQLI